MFTFVFQPPTVSVLSPRTGDSTTITTQSCLGVNSVGKITPPQLTWHMVIALSDN